MPCRLYVATSAAHWVVGHTAWTCISPGHWKKATDVWYRTAVWHNYCAGGATGLGYIQGGNDEHGGSDLIDELHLVTETLSLIASKLPLKQPAVASFVSTTRVYSSHYYWIFGLIFATKTTFNGPHLPEWRYDTQGTSDILKTGFVFGGRAGGQNRDAIYTVSLANGSTTDIRKYLYSRRFSSGAYSTEPYGYIFGGKGPSDFTRLISRINHAVKTMASTGGNLLANNGGAATVGDKIKVYLEGGANRSIGYTTTVSKYTMSNKAIAANSTHLRVSRSRARGLSAGIKGLTCGGRNATKFALNTIEGIKFPTGTVYHVHNSLALHRNGVGGGTTRGTSL